MFRISVQDRLEQLLPLLGEDFPAYRSRVEDLARHLEQGRINVAVLGQFKRGKSTLLNAVIAEKLLPSAVIPLTAIPTFLIGDSRRYVKVLFTDDKPPVTAYDDLAAVLAAYVTEKENPENVKKVRSVRIFLDHPILHQGITLIDTPGIGSTHTHNTRTTLDFLSKCDAALFVVSPDPPITEVEMTFLQQVHEAVPNLYFVLNKADLLTPEEREELLTFITGTLHRHIPDTRALPLFVLSARRGLEAALRGDEEGWKESGMAALIEDLFARVVDSRREALEKAVARRLDGLVRQVLFQVEITLSSLDLPLEELVEKHRLFEERLEKIEALRTRAQDMIEGDKKRTIETLETHAAAVRRETLESLGAYLDALLQRAKGEREVREAMEERIAEVYENAYHQLRGKMDSVVTAKMEALTKQAAEIIEAVREAAVEIFSLPPIRIPAPLFEKQRGALAWETHQWASTFSPVPEGAAEALLPAGIRKTRRAKRWHGKIKELTMHNTEHLRWALLQGINDTFRLFTTTFDASLKLAIHSTRDVITDTLEKRRAQGSRIGQERERMEALQADLKSIEEGG